MTTSTTPTGALSNSLMHSTTAHKRNDLPLTFHCTSPSTFTGEAKGGRKVVTGGVAATTITALTMPKMLR